MNNIEVVFDFIDKDRKTKILVNQVTEEVEGFDLDDVQPMSFNALDSIDSAKETLKTFF